MTNSLRAPALDQNLKLDKSNFKSVGSSNIMSKIFEDTENSIDEKMGFSDVAYTEGQASTERKPSSLGSILEEREESVTDLQESFFSNMANLNQTNQTRLGSRDSILERTFLQDKILPQSDNQNFEDSFFREKILKQDQSHYDQEGFGEIQFLKKGFFAGAKQKLKKSKPAAAPAFSRQKS